MTMERVRKEDMTLSTSAREYRGRDLDLACLAVVALVSLSIWPRGPGRQVVKSKAWQMAEGVGDGDKGGRANQRMGTEGV